MKVQELEKLVVRTQHDFLQAELKAADLAKQLLAAKAKNRRAKRAYKTARRASRKAKNLACEAAEQVSQQQRAFAKARKRLAKAWKKIGLIKTVPKMRSLPRPNPQVARKDVPAHSVSSARVEPPKKMPVSLLPRQSGSSTAGVLKQAQPDTIP